MLGLLADVDQLKCRYIDLQVVEELNLPVEQLEIDWKQLEDLKRGLVKKQKVWFSDIIEEDEDSQYYLKLAGERKESAPKIQLRPRRLLNEESASGESAEEMEALDNQTFILVDSSWDSKFDQGKSVGERVMKMLD
jgi:hypothetical protein